MPGVSLKVHIRNASDLPRGDSDRLSDPFIVCGVTSKEDPEFRTQACSQTLDPVWDEDHIIKNYKPGDDLYFKVLDEDNADKDWMMGEDSLGEVLLASHEFFPHGFEGEVGLENVPGGKLAILRLSIAVDDGQAQLPMPSNMPPTAMLPEGPSERSSPAGSSKHKRHHPHHGAGEPRPEHPRSHPGHGRESRPEHPRSHPGHGRESRGGSSSSTALPDSKFTSAVRRIKVTLISADGLHDLAASGRCDTYCVCEVQGKLHSKFQTVVANDNPEPVWDKTVDFDYTPGEPLVFSLLNKEVWPKRDSVLGTAVLSAEQVFPHGFDGELGLESAADAGSHSRRSRSRPILRVKVEFDDKAPVASEAPHSAHERRAHHSPQRHRHARGGHRDHEEAPETDASLPASKRLHLHEEPGHKRLKICMQSFRGLHGGDAAARRGFSAICSIAGHNYADLQTGLASETAFQTVWNFEGELTNYAPGEDLDFHVASQGGELGGGAILRSEQFYPFGFNSDLTLSSSGQGILGLLRVKVVVLKDDIPKTSVAPLGHRTVGLDQRPASDVTRTRLTGRGNESFGLRSHQSWDAREASLAVAQGAGRHKLSNESSALVKPTLSRLPGHATAGLRSAEQHAVLHSSSVASSTERAHSWVVPAMPAGTPAPRTAVVAAPGARIISPERGGHLLHGDARHVLPATTTATPTLSWQPVASVATAPSVVTTSQVAPSLVSTHYAVPTAATTQFVPATTSLSYAPPAMSAGSHTVQSVMASGYTAPGPVTPTFGAAGGYSVSHGHSYASHTGLHTSAVDATGTGGAPAGISSGALSLLAEARAGLPGGNREMLSAPGVLPPGAPSQQAISFSGTSGGLPQALDLFSWQRQGVA